jgi:hypothetical protein
MNRTAPRLLVVVFLVAIAVNFAWEMAQAELFEPMGEAAQATWRCLVASLGDGMIVLTISASGWLVFGRGDWFVRPGLKGYLFMGTLGIVFAVLIERHALSTGRWSYAGRMPIIPLIGVGFVPVVQMTLLPPVVFAVASRWAR